MLPSSEEQNTSMSLLATSKNSANFKTISLFFDAWLIKILIRCLLGKSSKSLIEVDSICYAISFKPSFEYPKIMSNYSQALLFYLTALVINTTHST